MAAVTWVACRESMPDDEMTVLIWLADDQEVWTGFRDGGQWRYVSGDPVGVAVSHWAEFPAGPVAGGMNAKFTGP